MRETHIVPLSRQAVGILRVVITGRQRYVFPAIGGGRPISENTLNGALRRIGCPGDVMTANGFRTMASTLLNEQGVHPDLIELQLAHAERNLPPAHSELVSASRISKRPRNARGA